MSWSLRRIEKETGVRRETASRYLKQADVPVRPPRRWGHGPPSKAVNETITDADVPGSSKAAKETVTDAACGLAGTPRRQSSCEPYRELIETALRTGRNAMSIYQELVDDHGFTAKYASVNRFIKKLTGTDVPEAYPVITTGPGEEGQVDYGEGPMVRHPDTGKYRRTRLFVLTLGYSRKSVRLLVFKSSSRIWAELHETSFRRLGGVPKVIVLDNLKEGVLKPDVFDPELNPLYRDVLGHYGAVALPCRVRHPDRKGKVESAIKHAQQTPLRGKRFACLADAQDYLDRWETNWADTRIHGTTKRQVGALFAEEKPHLQTLPITPFRYYETGMRTVHLDGTVEVKRTYYSAPPEWVGRKVQVQFDEACVRLLDPISGALLREHHPHSPGSHVRDRRDVPKKTPQSTEEILQRADNAGTSIGIVCRFMHGDTGEQAVRRILGLLSLAKKHGQPLVEDACSFALEHDRADYRFIKRYLQRKQPTQLSLKQIDPLIRELSLYRDLITQITDGGIEDEPARSRT